MIGRICLPKKSIIRLSILHLINFCVSMHSLVIAASTEAHTQRKCYLPVYMTIGRGLVIHTHTKLWFIKELWLSFSTVVWIRWIQSDDAEIIVRNCVKRKRIDYWATPSEIIDYGGILSYGALFSISETYVYIDL